MTGKEIMLRAIRFEETPRLPTAVIDGYLWMIKRLGISYQDILEMDSDKFADMALEMYDLLGSDIVYGCSAGSNAVRDSMGGSTNYSAKAENVIVTKKALSDPSDISGFSVTDVYNKVTAHPYYIAMGRQLEQLAKRAGGEKLVMAFCPGPLTMAASSCGVQELLLALCEDEDSVRRLLDFKADLSIKLLEYQIEHGATLISIPDPVASVNVISGEFFDAFALPYLKRVTSALRRHGLPIVLHICGDTTSRLVPLRDAGIDVFSVDSIDLENALEQARGHYAIFGTLSPVTVLKDMDAAQVYEKARGLAGTAGLGGGFIMAPGCDLAPETPVENIRAMVNAAHGRNLDA